MASKAELVQYIADQCSGTGAIRTLKMFGDYGIYCDGKIFRLICDNQLFIKITKAGKEMFPNLETAPPYEGAKPYFLFSDIDDRDALSQFIQVTCSELPEPKPKKDRRKQHGL